MTTHGFELEREQEIPEINARARIYRHARTGARLLSMITDDENKCFSIAFATPPSDSTGVAHILEHSVLCGSRKYPVKEPFVELMKGSLNTFLNAWTFPDKTAYPVASQNLQDFYNLVDVYLDAVFHPRITPHILQQEGWHFELDSPDAPLALKGVVFNEMKGAYSSPDSLLGKHTQETLFPDNAYGVDSGGDPAHIPDLTYDQFRAFHRAYYHPSNAFIYFYGDDDPDERLRLLDAYLGAFDASAPAPAIALQSPFAEPRRHLLGYDAGDDDGAGDGAQSASASKAYVSIAWLTGEVTDVPGTLALNILSHILVGTPASPLRKALIDSGLGEGLSASGLEDEIRQTHFTVGLKGVALENAGKVEPLILDTLRRLAAEGIDPATVEASLNTIEFARRENNTGGFPRGLAFMRGALSTWLHGGDPLAPLAFEAPLRAVREGWSADGRYFERLVESALLHNPHRVTLELRPDPEVRRRAEAAERARLDQARAAMGDAEALAVIADARELKRLQETPDTPEALATIPTLKLADLDRTNKPIPLAVSECQGARVLYHDLFTNGIVYLDAGFDLRALPQRLLPYVSLFGRALLGMGTQREDFVKLLQRIGRKTGGIRPASMTSVVRGGHGTAAWFFLRGKATTAQGQDLLDILSDILLTVKLDDRERFRQMVLEEKSGKEASLVPGGHAVVNTRLRARFTESDWASELMGGVSYLFFLRELVDRIDKDWAGVLADLEDIRRRLVNRRAMVCNVTLDHAGYQAFAPRLEAFVGALPGFEPPNGAWTREAAGADEGLTIPAQVNYVGKGSDLYRLGYRLHGSALVVTHYLGSTWLWEKVRVQGGAYGGFCVFDHRSGVLTYLSYRDPNVSATLGAYDGTAGYLRNLDLADEELTKAIIGVIGDLDAYQLPDAKGYTSMARYLIGETDALRQQMRDEVLGARPADFKAFGEVLAQASRGAAVVVLGAEQAIAAANAKDQLNLRVVKVM